MTVGERTRRLEAQVAYLMQRVDLLEARVFPVPQPAPAPPPAAPAAAPTEPTWAPLEPDWGPPGPSWAPPPAATAPPGSRPNLDLTPSRLLAVAGGLVLLLGLGYLLRYAVIRGWLGPEVRVTLALAGSAALAIVGIRLERNADTRVVGQICTATASAGAYAAVVAATVLYHFVPAGVGLLAASAIAGAAIARGAWTRTQGIAALGMGGALLSPVLVDAADGVITLGLLTVALTAGLFVAVRRRWPALTGLAFVLISPQLWTIAADRAPVAVGLLFAATCAGLLLAAAIAAGGGKPWDDAALPTGVAAANALSIAGLGYTVLSARIPGAEAAAGLWLIAVSAVHLGAGLRLARRHVAAPLAVVLIVLATGLADAAVLELAEGYAATLIFGVLATAGVLALHRDWLGVPARFVVVLQLFVLAVHTLLAVVGMAPLGSAEAVLFVAGAGAAAAGFAALVPAPDRDVGVIGGATLLGLGVARLLLFEAPLPSLLYGVEDLWPALISCAALAASGLALGRVGHRTFGIVAVGFANYGLSLAAVALDPDGAGRVALTGLWAAGGGLALVAGRRLQRPDVRHAGGALLLAATVKAAFVDTMMLDGTNRAAALLLCGSVLVATAVSEARSVGRSEAAPTP